MSAIVGHNGWFISQCSDLTAQVINQLSFPGVLLHGVNIKPGKPTI
jgi:molybdopterin biosynthesis enzyme